MANAVVDAYDSNAYTTQMEAKFRDGSKKVNVTFQKDLILPAFMSFFTRQTEIDIMPKCSAKAYQIWQTKYCSALTLAWHRFFL